MDGVGPPTYARTLSPRCLRRKGKAPPARRTVYFGTDMLCTVLGTRLFCSSYAYNKKKNTLGVFSGHQSSHYGWLHLLCTCAADLYRHLPATTTLPYTHASTMQLPPSHFAASLSCCVSARGGWGERATWAGACLWLSPALPSHTFSLPHTRCLLCCPSPLLALCSTSRFNFLFNDWSGSLSLWDQSLVSHLSL